MSSAELVAALRTVLGATKATLVQDTPSLGPWIQRYLDFAAPDSYYASGGGGMGWGFPAAMGMQLARPDERFITVSGDGSFWMVAQDLETAVRERLPVVTVINNNFAFGNTRDRQRTAHDGRYLGVFYSNPDLALAECWYSIRKLQARFFAGDYATALKAASTAQRLLWTSVSRFETAEYYFYGALSHAASCDSAAGEQRRQYFQ